MDVGYQDVKFHRFRDKDKMGYHPRGPQTLFYYYSSLSAYRMFSIKQESQSASKQLHSLGRMQRQNRTFIALHSCFECSNCDLQFNKCTADKRSNCGACLLEEIWENNQVTQCVDCAMPCWKVATSSEFFAATEEIRYRGSSLRLPNTASAFSVRVKQCKDEGDGRVVLIP
ncbi:hypothetical protein CSKR_108693 [Clonorchis sinensis]|nr:hypothetical protein CSKR_108693 [Clonorchis sinensis]